MSPWIIHAGRLILSPVNWRDLTDLQAIKADPRVFAIMLGGVRSPTRAAEELAEDMSTWARQGYGIWSVRAVSNEEFLGITGLMHRADNRGVALRFALWPEAQGRGLAREAASAALRFGHDQVGLARIIAVAREANFASRTILGGIGMVECDSFTRDGHAMLVYESVRRQKT